MEFYIALSIHKPDLIIKHTYHTRGQS